MIKERAIRFLLTFKQNKHYEVTDFSLDTKLERIASKLNEKFGKKARDLFVDELVNIATQTPMRKHS